MGREEVQVEVEARKAENRTKNTVDNGTQQGGNRQRARIGRRYRIQGRRPAQQFIGQSGHLGQWTAARCDWGRKTHGNNHS